MPGRRLVWIAIALLAATQAEHGWARGGHAHGGGSRGFVSAPRFVPRAVFYAAPAIYYYVPSSYTAQPYYTQPYSQPYAPAPYSPYSPYNSPPPSPAYVPPPASSAQPPAARPAAAPSQAPIYVCRDANGRTTVTNRPEDTVGLNCTEQGSQAARPAAAAQGPYAAQNALRYRYYCPDTRKYYPEVNICDSAWLKVVPDSAAARR